MNPPPSSSGTFPTGRKTNVLMRDIPSRRPMRGVLFTVLAIFALAGCDGESTRSSSGNCGWQRTVVPGSRRR